MMSAKAHREMDVTSDLYKCMKISDLIPELIGSIDELKKVDPLCNMILEIKASKKKLSMITVSNEADFDPAGVSEFQDKLVDALLSLGAGIRSIDVKGIQEGHRAHLMNVMADISYYQDEIARIAGK